MDIRTFSSQVQDQTIHIVSITIGWSTYSTGMDPVMAHNLNNQGRLDEEYLDYIMEEMK